MPLCWNDDRRRRPEAVAALIRFQQHWTSGRRVLVPAGVIALIAAVAASALFASADEPGSPRRPAAATSSRTDVLLPIGALVKQGWLPDPVLSGDRGTVGVPTGTPSPPSAPDPAQAVRQAPVIARYQGSAGTLTPAGIATLALERGCAPEPAAVAAAVAMAESGGSPSAQGDIALMNSVWDWSAGLWQIRGLRAERNTGGLRDSVANQAVPKNAAAMYTISGGCSNWTPWSTFNNGAYLQFMKLARSAVRYVLRYYAAHGHRYPSVPAPDPNATIPVRGPAGAAPARAGAAHTRSAAARPRRRGPAQHPASARPSSVRRAGTTTPTVPSTAPTAPATRSATSRRGRLPLPPPASTSPTTPPVKLPTLPVPLPTTSLPLPLPTLH